MRAVAAIPAAGLLAGAAAGLLAPGLPPTLQYIALALSFGVAVVSWRRGWPLCLGGAVAAAFFAGGQLLAVHAWQEAWRPSLWTAFEELAERQRADAIAHGRTAPLEGGAFAIVHGVLRADAAPGENGVSLTVWVDGIEDRERGPEDLRDARGGIAVTAIGSVAVDRADDFRAGRRVRMPVQLRRPSRYLDPGVPDFERALARRGTRLVGSVKSGALVELIGSANWMDERVGDLRVFARRSIARAVGRWSERSAAIVAAIVIGDRAGLDQDVQRRLQEAGTYHVIAISGGNIAILAGIFLFVFRVAGWLGRSAMLTAIAALLAYARLVGAGASVDRATMMAVVYFGARAFDQRSPPLNALAVVAIALVAADPLAIADPAFILTFGATLAILVIVPVAATSRKIPGRLRGRAHGGARVLTSMLAASVAAEALLFPVGAFVFARVTFAGLALNFLAIPMMGIAQVAGMAVVPLAAVSASGAMAAGWIAHAGAAGLVWAAALVDYAPALAYRVAPPSWAAVALYYAAGTLGWVLWRRRATVTGSAESTTARRLRRGSAGLASIAALWILIDPGALAAGRGDGRLHVTFLDVGQGDSTLVVFPRGGSMLVDSGGVPGSVTFDIGDRVVAPVMRAAGIRRLDYLVLTHGDPDHIGGAPAIVREFRPLEVWEGIPVPRFEPLSTLRTAAQTVGARWSNVYTGDAIDVDGVQVVARHPNPADWERQKVRNDDSLVLELRWRDVSVLLTGDIGKVPEHMVAPRLPASPLRVLKIPHHGSLTSSSTEFVAAARPAVAVVSAGRSNHFGHPVAEVLERYRDVGAEIFRTDLDGAVRVDTDGASMTVRGMTGRRPAFERRSRSHEDTK